MYRTSTLVTALLALSTVALSLPATAAGPCNASEDATCATPFVTANDPEFKECDDRELGGGTEDVWVCIHFNGCDQMYPGGPVTCMP